MPEAGCVNALWVVAGSGLGVVVGCAIGWYIGDRRATEQLGGVVADALVETRRRRLGQNPKRARTSFDI